MLDTIHAVRLVRTTKLFHEPITKYGGIMWQMYVEGHLVRHRRDD